MKDRISRVVVAGLLLAVLALPMPARAEAVGRSNLDGAWSWLASLWERGISALWSASGDPDQGHGIDPNGITTTVVGDPDQGHGIDPNG